jgi:DDE superfamily endonuclease
MPERLRRYLTAWLYDRPSGSGVAVAEVLGAVSHDRLTRMRQSDWSGQTLLELACRTLFGWQRGYLIIADTVIPKPFAAAIEGLTWVFSSQERKPVYGLSLVLLVWTNGTLRMPLGMRLWRKGGASKYVLALELLS